MRALLILSVVALAGCVGHGGRYTNIDGMAAPIVVISGHDCQCEEFWEGASTVTLRDATGDVRALYNEQALAILDNYSIGDTLK